MRLVFMGTPDFAVSTLKALLEAGHEVACVYSQPPRPAGRGMAERPSPVHAFAASKGIDVRTQPSVRRRWGVEKVSSVGMLAEKRTPVPAAESPLSQTG